MEPNVYRGMWAIVALLIAVVIGGAVMLIFPNFVGQVGNKMSDLMTSPSKIIAKSGLEKAGENVLEGVDVFSRFESKLGNAVSSKATYSFSEIGPEANLLLNSDFSQGEKGWGTQSGRFTIEDGHLFIPGRQSPVAFT